MNVERTYEATIDLPTDRETVITRSFAAPRELVFQALTNPEYAVAGMARAPCR